MQERGVLIKKKKHNKIRNRKSKCRVKEQHWEMSMCQYKKGREGEKLIKTWQKQTVRKNMALTACPEECSKGKKRKIVYFFV